MFNYTFFITTIITINVNTLCYLLYSITHSSLQLRIPHNFCYTFKNVIMVLTFEFIILASVMACHHYDMSPVDRWWHTQQPCQVWCSVRTQTRDTVCVPWWRSLMTLLPESGEVTPNNENIAWWFNLHPLILKCYHSFNSNVRIFWN